jgi:hypothetical protein
VGKTLKQFRRKFEALLGNGDGISFWSLADGHGGEKLTWVLLLLDLKAS